MKTKRPNQRSFTILQHSSRILALILITTLLVPAAFANMALPGAGGGPSQPTVPAIGNGNGSGSGGSSGAGGNNFGNPIPPPAMEPPPDAISWADLIADNNGLIADLQAALVAIKPIIEDVSNKLEKAEDLHGALRALFQAIWHAPIPNLPGLPAGLSALYLKNIAKTLNTHMDGMREDAGGLVAVQGWMEDQLARAEQRGIRLNQGAASSPFWWCPNGKQIKQDIQDAKDGLASKINEMNQLNTSFQNHYQTYKKTAFKFLKKVLAIINLFQALGLTNLIPGAQGVINAYNVAWNKYLAMP